MVPISFPKSCARACMGSCPGPFVTRKKEKKKGKEKKDAANTRWPWTGRPNGDRCQCNFHIPSVFGI